MFMKKSLSFLCSKQATTAASQHFNKALPGIVSENGSASLATSYLKQLNRTICVSTSCYGTNPGQMKKAAKAGNALGKVRTKQIQRLRGAMRSRFLTYLSKTV